jgi:oligopeptide transport system ATP-binding protein
MSENILTVSDLHTSFFTPAGEVKAVSGVSIKVDRGQVLGIVGESGSGKSVTMLSILHLLGPSGKIISGSVDFEGEELTTKTFDEMTDIRANKISMIFQDPMTSLNPVLSISYQLCEPLIRHRHMSRRAAKKRAIELLHEVGIEPAEERIKEYPHQFSGGQRQRIMIAMALACNPDMLIADEPTTALDVTVQAQILELMKDLQKKNNTAIIIITHDLGVIAGMADRVAVMYSGHIVEEGDRRQIFYHAAHPYTQGLLQSVPNPDSLVKKRLIPIKGQPPDLLNPPKGCPYALRCDRAMRICMEYPPQKCVIDEGHTSSCWLHMMKNKGGSAQ